MPWKPRERTEIVHIVVTGYQKMKYPRKHYVFAIDVTWNNSERFEVYRRYSDFFNFQTTLKALFPVAAGRRNEERVIPALPKRIFLGRSHVAKVAEARVEYINRYCQTLVSLEPRISESGHVTGFFSPRIGDKQLPKLHLHRPASLHPLKIPAGSLFQEYCALADYEAEDDSQVSFKSGDKVLVLSQDESGWWMCECSGKLGWAPPSYLKKSCNSNSEDSDSEDEYISLGLPESYKDANSRNKGGGEGDSTKDSDDSGLGSQPPSEPESPHRSNGLFEVPAIEVEEYKAIDSYEAEGPGQISFEEGDIITVVDKMEDGWWFVSKGQDEGWAPCSYLEHLNDEEDEDDAISSLDIEKYTSVDAYKAEEEDEVSFPNGAIVDVLQKTLDGWWFIKHNGKTGLAPATFLKKGERSNPTRKSSHPTQNITLTYQQPPRKQSVRVRASLKKYGKNSLANAFASAYKNGEKESQLLVSATAANRQGNVATREKPKPAKIKFPEDRDSSDSEDSLRSSPSPRVIKKNIQSKLRMFEKHSGSESSQSEDGGTPSSLVKPRVTPRSRSPKPKLKPKPTNHQSSPQSNVLDELNELPLVREKQDNPFGNFPKPQRPTDSELSRARNIPLILEPPAEQPKLSTPPRPSGNEIRRAHEKVNPVPSSDKSAFKPIAQRRSPSPTPSSPQNLSPLGTLLEESGEESDNSTSSKLHPPKQARFRSSSAAPLPPPSTQLSPTKPRRTKTRSESGASAVPDECSNPFNQQMADSMIKYILASNDPSLKAALRDIISGDPQVLSQIEQ